MVGGGLDVASVRVILGHELLTTTSRYSHALPDIAERMTAALGRVTHR